MTDKRIAYDTNEAYQDPETGMFNIAKIEENEPGFWRLPTPYPTLEAAQAEVNRLNDALGLHPGDVLDILSSSMAAHNAAKYGKGAGEDAAATPRIEILHERDLDSECAVRVWVDGVEVTDDVHVEDLDPGRGWLAADWDENHRDALQRPDLSESYRAAVDQAYSAGRKSKYVEEP